MGSVTHFIRVGRMSACSRSSTSAASSAARPRPAVPPGQLEQDVGGGGADGAAVAVVHGASARRRPRAGTRCAIAVAAERVHVLERRVGARQPPAEARAAEALADDVAVDCTGAHSVQLSRAPRSSGRAGSARRCRARGGRRGPSAASSRIARSLAGEEAREHQVERGGLGEHPAGGHARARAVLADPASQRQAARMRGHAVALHARRPRARCRRKTGSSGSSALAPATIDERRPLRHRAPRSVRRPPRAASPPAVADRAGRREPNQSTFSLQRRPRSAPAAGLEALAGHRADRAGAEGLHRRRGRPRPRRAPRRASRVCSAMASGVTLAWPPPRPASTGWRSQSGEDGDAVVGIDLGERCVAHAQRGRRRGRRASTARRYSPCTSTPSPADRLRRGAPAPAPRGRRRARARGRGSPASGSEQGRAAAAASSVCPLRPRSCRAASRTSWQSDARSSQARRAGPSRRTAIAFT